MELVITLAIWALQFALFARFMSRFGFSPAWGMTALVPIVPLVVLWYVAFAAWPIPDRNQVDSDGPELEAFG